MAKISNPDGEMSKALKLAQTGKLKQAIVIVEKLVGQYPHAAPARYNLALMLLQGGRLGDALPHLDRLLNDNPDFEAARYSKGQALIHLGCPAEAVEVLKGMQDAEGLLALANAARASGQMELALATGQKLVGRFPDFIAGQINHGQFLIEAAPSQAVTHLEQALLHHPNHALLLALLGQARLRNGHLEDAAQALAAAIQFDPTLSAAKGHLLRVCRELAEWDQEDKLFNELSSNIKTGRQQSDQLQIAVQEALFHPFDGPQLLEIARREAAFRVPKYQSKPGAVPKQKSILSIGYLSPDYRDHATMHLAADLFAAHNRDQVRIFGYSTGPDDQSEWRTKAQKGCDSFVDLQGLTDAEGAQRIAQDGIDILVDLSVYTRYARPGIAAQRPAPLSVAWLGLAASSGAPWIDYMVVDAALVPPDHRSHFSEKLIYLPRTYQANGAQTAIAPAPARSELDLPQDAFVLCSFNGPRKLDRDSITLWLDILSARPKTVLWLLAPHPVAQAKIRALAATKGVAPDRLIWAPSLPREQHISRMQAADLFIDTLICGAHTTAADALRANLPIVTVAGPTLGARVATSLLTALGHQDWIAKDRDSMRDLCLQLIDHPPAKVDPTFVGELFNPEKFAAELETAFKAIWARAAQGLSPEDIAVAHLK